jgi:dihydroflavonol-4-reductase
MKLILITGATGFLGKRLIEQLMLSERESHLRLLCRGSVPSHVGAGLVPALSDHEGRPYEDPQVEIVRGDVISAEDVSRAADGVNEIYHLAGVVSRNPKKKWLMYQTHIEGTRNVCEAARQHGVQKVVHVSSSGTIAVSKGPTVHDENSGYKHEIVGGWPYYLSKIFAEKLALNYHVQQQVPVVVVNPSLLLGSGDDRHSST